MIVVNASGTTAGVSFLMDDRSRAEMSRRIFEAREVIGSRCAVDERSLGSGRRRPTLAC